MASETTSQHEKLENFQHFMRHTEQDKTMHFDSRVQKLNYYYRCGKCGFLVPRSLSKSQMKFDRRVDSVGKSGLGRLKDRCSLWYDDHVHA